MWSEDRDLTTTPTMPAQSLVLHQIQIRWKWGFTAISIPCMPVVFFLLRRWSKSVGCRLNDLWLVTVWWLKGKNSLAHIHLANSLVVKKLRSFPLAICHASGYLYMSLRIIKRIASIFQKIFCKSTLRQQPIKTIVLSSHLTKSGSIRKKC